MWRNALFATIFALIWGHGAHAGLEICNNTDELQSLAIGYKGDRDWTSEGWWNIEPGDCALLIAEDLTKRYYYYHADSRGGGFRGQNFVFCTRDDEFTIVGDTECKGRGYADTEFREIDTGETATSFTLTLVSREAAPNSGNSGAKGPGGGDDEGEVATQSVTETPEETDVTVDDNALQTGLPPGRSGEPFEVTGLFQGCELEDGQAYCGFHADGLKLRAYYSGATPDELLYALEEMDMNMPVLLRGDQVEAKRLHASVVLRSVEPRPASDRHADLRAMLQGEWALANDRRSEVTIRGSEIYVRYDSQFRQTRFMKLAERCEGLRGAGPVMIQTSLRDRRPKCYRVVSASADALALEPVGGGSQIRFRRPR